MGINRRLFASKLKANEWSQHVADAITTTTMHSCVFMVGSLFQIILGCCRVATRQYSVLRRWLSLRRGRSGTVWASRRAGHVFALASDTGAVS